MSHGRESRIPRSGDAQGEERRMGEKAAYLVPETLKEKECRMPFIGLLKGAC